MTRCLADCGAEMKTPGMCAACVMKLVDLRADLKSLLLRKVVLERHVAAMAGTMTAAELADLEHWQRHADKTCAACGCKSVSGDGRCTTCGASKATYVPGLTVV